MHRAIILKLYTVLYTFSVLLLLLLVVVVVVFTYSVNLVMYSSKYSIEECNVRANTIRG